MECIKCKRTFLKNERIVSMSGSIMGEACWDNFTGGDETIEARGPLDKAKGDERIAIIMRCDRPWDKKCRCEAHREYFNDTLD